MKAKSLFASALSIILLVGIVGCSQNKELSVSRPRISMKSITQASYNNFVTVTCELPEDWELLPRDFFSFYGASTIHPEKKVENMVDRSPYIISIKSYQRTGGTGSKEPEELIQMYKDLFAGNPEKYKLFLNYQILNKYHNNEIEATVKNDYLKDFNYKYYKSSTGNIAEVQYAFEYQGKIYRQIDCIREDIPYIISGGFNKSLAISSGDIALWVAYSLKVSDNLTK